MNEVNIIGKGQGWQDAPTERCWGINHLILWRPVNTVFEMHPIHKDGDEIRQKAKDINAECITLENYPIEEIKEYFKTDYFPNSICYAIALAIYRGYRVINFYGVNMFGPDEYLLEKGGVEFWMGQAMGRGVEVNIYGKITTVLKTKDGLLYGYGTKQKS